jgi:hypothetical protein
MIKKYAFIAICFVIISLCSFQISESEFYIFEYPKKDHTTLKISLKGFNQFKKEFRGSDYLIESESDRKQHISILYYVLNEKERHQTQFFQGEILKKEFSFFDKTITCKEGVKTAEKNMYAVSLVDSDMFVIVHLSKENYNRFDSIEMHQMIRSVELAK